MRLLRWALLACVLAVVVTGAGYWHAGYRVYVVHTGSMVPTYDPGDIVIDKPAAGRPQPGQVITFRHDATTADVVTHRVTEVTASGLIHTKGDANASADVWDIQPSMVRGQVVRGVPRLGYLLVFLRQPAGIGALACCSFALFLLWGLFFEPDQGAATAGRGRHAATGRRRGPSARYTPISSMLD